MVWWNIRAGGGRRIEDIRYQILDWRSDIVGLSEFRGTPPSIWLADGLRDAGLCYQVSTVDPRFPSQNSLLVASRWPICNISSFPCTPETRRWVMVRVFSPRPLYLGVMHAPNRVTGRKPAFLSCVYNISSDYKLGDAFIGGDTNSGCIGVDEENPTFSGLEDGWMRSMETAGWSDAFRYIYGSLRAYSWYSPNGRNGFRLDQAFANRGMAQRIRDARYVWGTPRGLNCRRDVLSDHAALLVDLHC